MKTSYCFYRRIAYSTIILYISNVPLCNAGRGFSSATLVRTALALAPPTTAAYCPAAGCRSGTSWCSWRRGGRRGGGHGHSWEGNEKFITVGEFLQGIHIVDTFAPLCDHVCAKQLD